MTETNSPTSTDMGPSRLLSLPKELRLAIWAYTLTDSSVNTLRISRQGSGPSTSGQRFTKSLRRDSCTEMPQPSTKFEKRRTSAINVHLLRTNRLIYQETMPILYGSVQFHPSDLEGIFPLFLETISPLAQFHIRYVKLSLPTSFQNPSSYFYWALTCAQVAKFSDSLREVEVEGEWPLPKTGRRKDNLLYPLLKIKAPKKFNPLHDDEFQKLLEEARAELENKTPLRRTLTAASNAEWAKRAVVEPPKVDKALEKRKFQELTYADYPPFSPPPVDENVIAKDLSRIAGIKKFQSDLEQWELVMRDGETVSAGPSNCTPNLIDDDTWTDAASTIIAKDDDDDENAKDKDWEFVGTPTNGED